MDIKDIKKLIELATKSDLAELEYTQGEIKIRIVRGQAPQIQYPMGHMISGPYAAPQLMESSGGASQAIPAGTVSPTPVDKSQVITSPMVGTFYRASAPDSAPFVDGGTTVEVDQTVCIIEAMKLMNEIKAEFRCKILEVLVENGHAVEFGQPLFRVEKL